MRILLVAGLILSSVLAALSYSIEYKNTGWWFLGRHIYSRPSPFKQAQFRPYGRTSTESLGPLIKQGNVAAIYEAGRRDAREFVDILNRLAAGPEWAPPPPSNERYGIGASLALMRHKAKYEARIASLAVLAKWGSPDAEEAIYSGIAMMPVLSAHFVPALAFVGTRKALLVVSSFKTVRGQWICKSVSDGEMGCEWNGLEFSKKG